MITAKIPEAEFPLPKLGTADLHGPIDLEAHGLDPRGVVRWNYETPELQQHALRRGDGAFSSTRRAHVQHRRAHWALAKG